MVIKETQRLFPVVALLARVVPDEMEVCGKRVPAGTYLVLNLIGTHRDPRYWPDPLTFDPDRFLPERSAGRHPYCYLPFGGGPRDCIGRQYAMMQMKTFLATTLRAYSIHPAQDGITRPDQVPLTTAVVLYQVGGTLLRFEPR
jgi:cytochrome P450 family 4